MLCERSLVAECNSERIIEIGLHLAHYRKKYLHVGPNSVQLLAIQACLTRDAAVIDKNNSRQDVHPVNKHTL